MEQIITDCEDRVFSKIMSSMFEYMSSKVEAPKYAGHQFDYSAMISSLRDNRAIFRKLSRYARMSAHFKQSKKFSRGVLQAIDSNARFVQAKSKYNLSLNDARFISYYHCIVQMLGDIDNQKISTEEKDAKARAVLVTYISPFNDAF